MRTNPEVPVRSILGSLFSKRYSELFRSTELASLLASIENRLFGALLGNR